MKNEPTVQVAQLFEAIQGESLFAGYPFLFIRLAGCSLHCSWCDTKETWAPDAGIELSLDHLIARVNSFGRKRILLTGGEPLEQKNTRLLIDELLKTGRKIHLETNGTQSLAKLPSQLHIIMDIKPPSAKCKTPFLESNLAYLKPHDEVKIVVDTYQDLQFALDMEAYHSLSERFAFAISPTSAWGTPLTELQNKIMATGLDIRIAPQLHKHYFMDP